MGETFKQIRLFIAEKLFGLAVRMTPDNTPQRERILMAHFNWLRDEVSIELSETNLRYCDKALSEAMKSLSDRGFLRDVR